jgi:hypothetical protein
MRNDPDLLKEYDFSRGVRGKYAKQAAGSRSRKMIPSVSGVTPNEDFTLIVRFDNGEEGLLDMKPYLNFGAFRKIADSANFKNVRVAFDSIEWDAGVDLDPEFVYARSRITSKA